MKIANGLCEYTDQNDCSLHSGFMIQSGRGVFDVYCWRKYHIGKRLGNVVRYGKVDGPVSPQLSPASNAVGVNLFLSQVAPTVNVIIEECHFLRTKHDRMTQYRFRGFRTMIYSIFEDFRSYLVPFLNFDVYC